MELQPLSGFFRAALDSPQVQQNCAALSEKRHTAEIDHLNVVTGRVRLFYYAALGSTRNSLRAL